MNGKRIRAFYVNATAWSFDSGAKPHIVAARERQAAEFDAWLDEVRAEARREGQAEALREAAATDDPDHDTEVALGGSDYVRVWLHARADRIENGAAQ